MDKAGQGVLLEQFPLKAALESQGLFDPGRKRALPALPRRIGVVAWAGLRGVSDSSEAVRRRAPHVPVVLSPALVPKHLPIWSVH